MQARLIPEDGGNPIVISRDLTLVGRKPELCDVVLDKGSISKLHCIIVKTDGLLFIRDLASTNGTKVNGQKVTRGALLPGDNLAFASVKFHVHLGPADSKRANPNQPTEMLTSFPNVSDPHEQEWESFLDDGPIVPERPIIADPKQDSESDVRLLQDDSVV